MKKLKIPVKVNRHFLSLIIYSGIISITLFTTCFVTLIRGRTIELDRVLQHLAIQSEVQVYNPTVIPKFVEQRPLRYEMKPDFRCLSWSTNQVGSGWTPENNYHVFFIDYYVPPDKKAIICTTPALATILDAVLKKPLLYKIYPTDYGLHVRVIIGVSEAVKPCINLTGNVNCVSPILLQQAVVKYEP